MAQHYNCSTYPEMEGITFIFLICYLLLSFCILGYFHTMHFFKNSIWHLKRKSLVHLHLLWLQTFWGFISTILFCSLWIPFLVVSLYFISIFSFFFRKISSSLPSNYSLKLHFCYYIIKLSKLFFMQMLHFLNSLNTNCFFCHCLII